MRIVQVCPYSWAASGGVQTHVRHLARQLGSRGHTVRILAAGPVKRRDGAAGSASAATFLPADDTDVHTIGSAVRYPFNGSIAPICLHPRSVLDVRRALLEFQADVVHVHEPLVPGVSVSATLFSQAPVVATFHTYCPPSFDASFSRVASLCLRWISRRMAVRLGVSQAAATFAESRVGGTVDVVPNGVDIESFARAVPAALPGGRKLLFVGRLDGRKGFDVAVRAFTRLSERFSDLLLVVVGDGPCRDAAETVPPAVRRRIVMLGEMDNSQLPPIYAAADVFTAPAVGHESFGIVLLEAMAAGLPIVTTNIEGYRDVVRDGVDALLVDPQDDRALAAAIARILDTPALGMRLGLSARDRVQRFSWDVVTDAIERAYSAALGLSVVNRAARTVPIAGESL